MRVVRETDQGDAQTRRSATARRRGVMALSTASTRAMSSIAPQKGLCLFPQKAVSGLLALGCCDPGWVFFSRAGKPQQGQDTHLSSTIN